MNNAVDNKPVSRVLIALDAMQENPGALETAIALAAHRQSELMMLFIEDMNLVNLAGLPFASEIDRISATERKLDSIQMTRTFRSQAQRLTRQLEQMTRQKNVSYSLKIVRGHYMQEALSAFEVMDVLFMSRTVGKYSKRITEQNLASQKPVSHYHVSSNAVWLIYNDNPAIERAFTLASDIASATQRNLVVMIHGDEDRVSQVKQQISQYGDRDFAINYFIFAPVIQEDAVIEVLRSRQCEMLVLPISPEGEEQRKADRFLEGLEIPVVVVR